jgi:hypothetical protein
MRPPDDTVRFEAPAGASRCGGRGLGFVLRGIAEENGVMIWLRPGDSLARGELPLLPRAGSATTRGATVAVRFAVGDIVHAVTLDSGAVSVTQADGQLAVTARGSGVDGTGQEAPARVMVDASFDVVPLGSDTVPCQARP